MGTFIAVMFCMAIGALIVQMIRVELFLFPQAKEVIREAKAALSVYQGQSRASDAVVERVVGEVQAVKRDTVRAAEVASHAAAVASQTAKAIAEVPEKVREALKTNGDHP